MTSSARKAFTFYIHIDGVEFSEIYTNPSSYTNGRFMRTFVYYKSSYLEPINVNTVYIQYSMTVGYTPHYTIHTYIQILF